MTNSRRTGTGMFIIGWIILLVMLTWYFGIREEQRYNPNQILSTTGNEIVLEKNAFDQYVFSGKINGVTVNFLVDTGANSVVVNDQVARQIGLTSGQPVTILTASGYTNAWRTRLSSLEIGHIILKDIDALISPDMPGDQVLLGMSALEHINFRKENNRFIFHK